MGRSLEELDPRLKIVGAVALGACAWHAGVLGLAVYAAALVLACLALGAFRPQGLRILRAGLIFVAAWTLLVFLLALRKAWPGQEPLLQAVRLAAPEAISAAGLSGARLLIMLLTGLGLALAASARQLGLALAWALRPVLGRRAWQSALALALMVHFLPLVWETLDRVRLAMRMRRVGGPPWKRMALTAQAALRILGQRTWTQALAVAARGLDRPEAWQPDFPGGAAQWLLGACVLAAAAGLAFI